MSSNGNADAGSIWAAIGAEPDSFPKWMYEETYGPTWMVTTNLFMALSILVVGYRVYHIGSTRGWLGLEDYSLLLALAVTIILTVTGDISVKNGFGHWWQVLPFIGAHPIPAFKYAWVFRSLYYMGVAFVKDAYLLLYLRLFPTRKTRIACWISVVFVTAVSLVFTLLTFLDCDPVTGSYDLNLNHIPKCLSIADITWGWTSFDIATDLWIVAIPCPSIFGLQMSMQRKLSAMALFACALVNIALVTARTAVAVQAVHVTAATFDFSYKPCLIMVWSQLECCVGLILACTPSLKQPISRLFSLHLTTMGTSGTAKKERGAVTSTNAGTNLSTKNKSRFEVTSNDVDEEVPAVPAGA